MTQRAKADSASPRPGLPDHTQSESARIGPDGSFRFDRAPVGKVVVRLFDVPLEAKGAIWLLRTASPIRRETQSPEGPPMRIDVAEELYRHQLNKAGAGR